MAGTGRTQHYDIPIYNAGDTVNDLNTYNNAMEIIDTQLDTVDTLATANQEEFTSLNAQVQKQQGDITKLQEGVVNAQGTANGALAQIQEIVSPTTVRIPKVNANVAGVIYFSVNDSIIIMRSFYIDTPSTPPSITVSGTVFYIYGKADNQNPFNLNANEIQAFDTIFITHRPSAPTITIYTVNSIRIFYDGVNTYVLSNDDWSKTIGVDNIDVVTVCPLTPILRNGQPRTQQ